MAEYKTQIKELRVISQDPKLGLQDVVYAVSIIVTGTDGVYTHSVTKEFGIGQANPTDFTPLADLTEAQVKKFVNDAMAKDDMQAIRNEIDDAIEQQKNPNAKPKVVVWDK
jgi:hypothetical protein